MEIYKSTRFTKDKEPNICYAIGEMEVPSARILCAGNTLEMLARAVFGNLVTRGGLCSIDFVNRGDNFVVSRVVRDGDGVLHIDERKGLTSQEYEKFVSWFFSDSYIRNA